MFKLIKKDGNARRGEFHTVHGVIQTPVFMNVGTAAAIKGLWIQLYDGGIDGWIRGADSLIQRYGKKLFYFIFPGMSMAEADRLLNYAYSHWE